MKNLLLITSNWGEKKTFRMIPINNDCPYIEVVFSPDHKSLAVINKYTKQQFKYLPKVDVNGDTEMMKGSRPGGQRYREERKEVKVNYEHYLLERDEQKAFIEMFAINADTFNYIQYLDAVIEPEPVQAEVEVAVTEVVPVE